MNRIQRMNRCVFAGMFLSIFLCFSAAWCEDAPSTLTIAAPFHGSLWSQEDVDAEVAKIAEDAAQKTTTQEKEDSLSGKAFGYSYGGIVTAYFETTITNTSPARPCSPRLETTASASPFPMLTR